MARTGPVCLSALPRIGCGKHENREFRAMRLRRLPAILAGMLVLTPEAVGAVVEFVVGQDAGEAAGLRISPGPHSAVDRTWDYSVVHEPLEGDVVIEDGRARVFVDSDAAKELEHAVLDANVDEHTLEPRFIVRTGSAG
jgi:iron-sulfur cluster assembly protein